MFFPYKVVRKSGKNLGLHKIGMKSSSAFSFESPSHSNFQSISDSFPIPDVLPRASRQDHNTTFYFPPIERDFERALTAGNNSKALVLLLEHRSKKQPMSISLNNKLLQLCSGLGYYTMSIQIYNEMVVCNRFFRIFVYFFF